MKPKKITLLITSVVLGIILSTAFLEVIFRILPTSDSLMALPVNSKNPVLRFKQNRDIIVSRGYNFSTITNKHVNNDGFLNDQDYNQTDDSLLLAIIGDSYVEAVQVENRDAMHGILSKETAGKGRVYSFGASGAPLSTYLAYGKYATKKFRAQALAFIIIGNDFDESLMKYKKSPGNHYFSSATNQADLVRIDYKPSRLKRLSRQSALMRYVALNLKLNFQSLRKIFNSNASDSNKSFIGNTLADVDEERISESEALVNIFLKELPLRTDLENDKILFVIDGMRPHLYNTTTLIDAQGSYFDHMRNYFIKAARSKGYEVIDMQPIFIKDHESKGLRFEFPSDAHWNETGHFLAAKAIKASTVYRNLFEN